MFRQLVNEVFINNLRKFISIYDSQFVCSFLFKYNNKVEGSFSVVLKLFQPLEFTQV